MRAVIVAGTHSGCGKTTISLGLMAAFNSMGLKVQPFKCGPDFIDAGLHRLITGVSSRNLDIWMCGEDYVRECFYKHSKMADISIIEGVMGMYDGQFSTVSLAKLLNLPVILVIDAYGMAESAGAVVKGFMEYSSIELHSDRSIGNFEETATLPYCRTNDLIIGVIFNRVASENHFMRLKNSVRDVPVLGYLPRNLDFEIPSRHLGLMVAEENPIDSEGLNKLVHAVHIHIDIKALISICEIKSEIPYKPLAEASLEMANCNPQFKRMAVAYDKSFCFYYEDNLDLLRNACVEIVYFSPLEDSSLPDNIDAVYLGGGYPELYAENLSSNINMLKEIYDWSQSGMPLYAECGGLMYLTKGIYDQDNRFFKMCGVFPFETSIRLNRRSFLGYRETVLQEDCLLGYKGNILRGHEFHYSEIKDRGRNSAINRIYSVRDNNGKSLEDEGYSYKKTLASYIHLHFGSNPQIANNFINFIRRVQ